MRINEGYEIIYSSKIDDETEVVLGLNRKSGMYVTWLSIPKRDYYYWGHYFSSEVEALRDLANRIEEMKNNG